MKLNDLLKIATYAGTILLENGGETYRVEEVVNKICNAFDIEVNCYATITGIVATATNSEGDSESSTVRVTHRTINLDIIHKINHISSNIQDYDIYDFYNELKNIKNEPRHSKLKNSTAYSLGGASFTLLFGGSPLDFLGSLFIGIVIFLYIDYFSKFDINSFFINCIGSALLAFCAVIFLKIGLIENLDTTISGTIMLLVPGMALTNSIRDLIAGDYMAGISRGVEALLIATSLATGSGFVLTILL